MQERVGTFVRGECINGIQRKMVNRSEAEERFL